ncbi:hypothetical protein [Ktedonospora formicarum]|uniref:Uncharacterized protein n=1 Tax=Ktedonospora formicarum TaxID=2778364 RepID=A0A8J3HUZ8_9CHLR|nr:hypothetical protein [Ktedonospora formicarum]GHO43746.1 hypothetical protein KSX_19090 [Ktedonospora formicarum]
MASTKNNIFREDAYKRYLQRQEQGIVLRLVAPPTWIFLWLLLVLFLGATILAWLVRLPVFVTGQGILIQQETANEKSQYVSAALFLASIKQTHIHPGQPTELSVGSTATPLHGTIDHIEAHTESPLNIRTRFGLQGENTQLVSGPSVVVIIRLEPEASGNLYAGSAFSARIQVGSQSALSLLPGLNQILT